MQLPRLGLLLAAARPAAAASCSGAEDNCLGTGCCEDAGLSCFQKNEEFAACRAECEPGVHEDDAEDFRTPWSCKQLEAGADAGEEPEEEGAELEARCSETGEDCRSTGCCADSSMECFEKNREWATCMETCEPGEHEEDPEDLRTPWSCKRPSAFCFDAFQQCGGHGHPAKAATCCKPGCRCDSSFKTYNQCLPISDTALSCEEAASAGNASADDADAAGNASADDADEGEAAVVRLASTREELAAWAPRGRPGAEAARGHGIAAAIVVGCGAVAAMGVGVFVRRGVLRTTRGAPRALLQQDAEVE